MKANYNTSMVNPMIVATKDDRRTAFWIDVCDGECAHVWTSTHTLQWRRHVEDVTKKHTAVKVLTSLPRWFVTQSHCKQLRKGRLKKKKKKRNLGGRMDQPSFNRSHQQSKASWLIKPLLKPGTENIFSKGKASVSFICLLLTSFDIFDLIPYLSWKLNKK